MNANRKTKKTKEQLAAERQARIAAFNSIIDVLSIKKVTAREMRLTRDSPETAWNTLFRNFTKKSEFMPFMNHMANTIYAMHKTILKINKLVDSSKQTTGSGYDIELKIEGVPSNSPEYKFSKDDVKIFEQRLKNLISNFPVVAKVSQRRGRIADPRIISGTYELVYLATQNNPLRDLLFEVVFPTLGLNPASYQAMSSGFAQRGVVLKLIHAYIKATKDQFPPASKPADGQKSPAAGADYVPTAEMLQFMANGENYPVVYRSGVADNGRVANRDTNGNVDAQTVRVSTFADMYEKHTAKGDTSTNYETYSAALNSAANNQQNLENRLPIWTVNSMVLNNVVKVNDHSMQGVVDVLVQTLANDAYRASIPQETIAILSILDEADKVRAEAKKAAKAARS